MKFNKMRLAAVMVGAGLLLAACGSAEAEVATGAEDTSTPQVDSTETDTETEVDVELESTTTTVDVIEPEAVPDQTSSTIVLLDGSEVETPAVGTEIQATFLPQNECRTGEVTAFGVTWRLIDGPNLENLPPLAWRGQTVEGTFRFDTWESATFENAEATMRLTFSGATEDECLSWQ